jgi:hypothetical protein
MEMTNPMHYTEPKEERLRQMMTELIIGFNNSGGKNHTFLHGKDAFFDAWPSDRQAWKVRDLDPGQRCIVARPESNGQVSFRWFEFSRRGDGHYDGKPCWVFYGNPLKPPVRMQKSLAARTKPYSMFFNVNGHFKRQCVLSGWF